MEGKIIDFKPREASRATIGNDGCLGNLVDAMKEDLEEVEHCLKGVVGGCPSALKPSLMELVYLKSERLPALLFLACAKLFGPLKKEQYRMGAALETLNLALNIHELLKGNYRETDKTKRENIYNRQLLSGDYLLSFSLSLIAEYPEFVRGMAEIICRNVEGSFMEKTLETQAGFDAATYRKTYLHKISHKSASPFALSCALGGWSCGAPPSRIELLAYYGHYLGLARQMETDLLEFENRVYRWLVKGKGKMAFTLPLIYILETSAFRDKLLATLSLNFWGKKERELWEQEINRNNYKAYIRTIINDNCKEALTSINSFPSGYAKEALMLLSGELELLT